MPIDTRNFLNQHLGHYRCALPRATALVVAVIGKHIVHALVLFIALMPASALAALEWDEAKHLLLRTGFVPTPGEIAQLTPLTREQAVDALLATTRTVARTTPPAFCTIPYARYRNMQNAEQTMMEEPRDQQLKMWWYQEMVTTDSPLTERMVLFWHNHFTSSISKVEDVRLLYEQNALLRRGALGNFALLMRDIDLDPAMFKYLDKDSNRANSPNENYAREVMELFTLGEGQLYGEADIKEAARAFTGYQLDSQGRVVAKGDHDPRKKIVLGHEVKTGQDVILQLLLKEERVATYIAGKFWSVFVSSPGANPAANQPDDIAIRQLASVFYQAKYDIRTLLRATLLCDAFWDLNNRGTLIKSPVEFIIGLTRSLHIPNVNYRNLIGLGKLLGEELFEPPNVKGWKGGTTWLNCETMLQRWRAVDSLVDSALKKPDATKKKPPTSKPVFAKKADQVRLSPEMWQDTAKEQGAAGITQAINVLLPLPPDEPIQSPVFANALRAILHDSTFHLK